MARVRVQEIKKIDGRAIFINQSGTVITNNPDNTVTLRHSCTDSVGKSSDHPMTIVKYDHNMRTLSGTRLYPLAPLQSRQYQNFMPASIEANSVHLTTTLPSPAADAATLLTRTYPGRPGVTPLTLAQDLIELPRMVREVGSLLSTPRKHVTARKLAGWNLAVQFGWLPLIHDTMQLLNLQSAIHKRAEELTKLYNNGGLKRRLNLGGSNSELTSTISVESQLGILFQCRLQRRTEAKRWGTVRWKPTSLPPSPPGTRQFNQYARKIVSGMTFDGLAQGAWDVIPWTWLLDWFSNTGDYIHQNGTGVPCRPQLPNIMTFTKTDCTWTRIDPNGEFSGLNGSSTRITKDRYVGGGTIEARLPFLSGKQLSILGSLGVQRFRGLI